MNSVVASIILHDCNQKAIIPFRNIDGLSPQYAFNNSFRRKKTFKIFWSNHFEKIPNFTLPISKRFNQNEDACFNAKILLTFGKISVF